MSLTVLLLQLLSYACISGIKDGILWSKKGADSFTWNEHIVFIAERATIGSIVFIFPLLSNTSFLDSIVVLAIFCMCFSFLHNGFYYTTRRYIDVDYYTWFSESKTISAKFNFGYVFRTVLFILGVLFMLCFLLGKQ